MRVGSLFSGIGGIDLGLERAGMEIRWQVEYDPFCTTILEKHWPNVRRYGDVCRVEWEGVEPVDIVAGGFPCQPVSTADKQLAQDDERWLWPEFSRCLRVVRPRFVLLENVPGLLVRGLGDVLGDLADGGYDAEWESLPASAFGAPHLRWRVFLVAQRRGSSGLVSDADGRTVREQRQRAGEQRPEPRTHESGDDGEEESMADTDGWGRPDERVEEPRGVFGSLGSQPDGRSEIRELIDQAGRGWWDVEPPVRRVVDRPSTFLDRCRLTALGNAVVPQIAQFLGERIINVGRR